MTPEAQRIAIAEACGYERRLDGYWREKGMVGSCGIPNYLNDLNAMHEAERTVGLHGEDFLGRKLRRAWATYTALCDPRFLTADQRAQALLKTINKWENDN